MHKIGGERRSAGKGVDVLLTHAHAQGRPIGQAGLGPGRHVNGVAEHQERPRRQSRVQEILAQAAEELLDHHNGKEIADDQNPIGHRHRTDKGQKDAGDNGRQVAYGIALLHQPPIGPLKEDAGRSRDHSRDEGPEAKEEDGHAQGGYQRDDDIPHQISGVNGGGHVGRGCHFEPQCLFLTHTFAASFAFCLAAILRSSALAVRKDWTRGMRAGQM